MKLFRRPVDAGLGLEETAGYSPAVQEMGVGRGVNSVPAGGTIFGCKVRLHGHEPGPADPKYAYA